MWAAAVPRPGVELRTDRKIATGELRDDDEMGRDYRSAFYGQAEHVRVGYLKRDDAFRLTTQPHPDLVWERPELLLTLILIRIQGMILGQRS
ncbi:MAG: hypothetical protein GY856_38075 [bacterium]|nr:hypothetical protein [bacterium]